MIEFINVKKKFKQGTIVLSGVTFNIKKGEFVFITGESGSGKSTLSEPPPLAEVGASCFNVLSVSFRLVLPELHKRKFRWSPPYFVFTTVMLPIPCKYDNLLSLC